METGFGGTILYSGPLPCFPPGVCLSGEWARGPEHKLLPFCCFPKKKRLFPGLQSRRSRAWLASHPHPTPSSRLGGQPIKRLPNAASIPTHSAPPPAPRTKPVTVPTDRHLVAQSLETHELFSEAKRQDVGRSTVRVTAATTSSHRSLFTT